MCGVAHTNFPPVIINMLPPLPCVPSIDSALIPLQKGSVLWSRRVELSGEASALRGGGDSAGVLSLEQDWQLNTGGTEGLGGILILELTLEPRSLLHKLHGVGLQFSLREMGRRVKLVFPDYWKNVI